MTGISALGALTGLLAGSEDLTVAGAAWAELGPEIVRLTEDLNIACLLLPGRPRLLTWRFRPGGGRRSSSSSIDLRLLLAPASLLCLEVAGIGSTARSMSLSLLLTLCLWCGAGTLPLCLMEPWPLFIPLRSCGITFHA